MADAVRAQATGDPVMWVLDGDGNAVQLRLSDLTGAAGASTPPVELSQGTVNLPDATPVQLNGGVSLPTRVVLVQNDPESVDSLVVGLAAARYLALRPGEVVTLPVSNVNLVWVQSAGSSRVNWLSGSEGLSFGA